MTIGYGELKKGMSIEMDGEPYSVVDYERSKMQKRAPVMRIRFRNLKTGRIVDKTFSGYDVNFSPASVERRKAQYIYRDSDLFYFMDTESKISELYIMIFNVEPDKDTLKSLSITITRVLEWLQNYPIQLLKENQLVILT